MMKCQYPSCSRRAQYFMGWTNKNDKTHWGLVCATHDRLLGRKNLAKIGMPTNEAILFERYLKETVDLEVYLDFPEWLNQIGKTYTPPTLIKTKPTPYTDTTSVDLLRLPPRVQNTLRRNGITTIKELINIGPLELLRIRTLGTKGVREIQQKLEAFKRG